MLLSSPLPNTQDWAPKKRLVSVGYKPPNEQAQESMRVPYFIGLLTRQFPIKTGQADGEGLERAKRKAEVHGERVWGHAAKLQH